MVSVLFALMTALFNRLASVFQRMAASTAPAAKALHQHLGAVRDRGRRGRRVTRMPAARPRPRGAGRP